MINYTLMDDIEIGTNVFIASAHQDYFSTMTTSWRQKMNVEQSYILCPQLNCKCYLVNMTTTIMPCSINIGICMVLVLRNKYLLSLSKPTKSWRWKYALFLWKTPTTRYWNLTSYLMICQKHSNPRFYDRRWAKMI
jgi:hypothetical protein